MLKIHEGFSPLACGYLEHGISGLSNKPGRNLSHLNTRSHIREAKDQTFLGRYTGKSSLDKRGNIRGLKNFLAIKQAIMKIKPRNLRIRLQFGFPTESRKLGGDGDEIFGTPELSPRGDLLWHRGAQPTHRRLFDQQVSCISELN